MKHLSHQERRARGVCARCCAAAPEPGATRCARCIAIDRARQLERYRALAAGPRCVSCPRERAPGSQRCVSCRDVHRARVLDRYLAVKPLKRSQLEAGA